MIPVTPRRLNVPRLLLSLSTLPSLSTSVSAFLDPASIVITGPSNTVLSNVTIVPIFLGAVRDAQEVLNYYRLIADPTSTWGQRLANYPSTNSGPPPSIAQVIPININSSMFTFFDNRDIQPLVQDAISNPALASVSSPVAFIVHLPISSTVLTIDTFTSTPQNSCKDTCGYHSYLKSQSVPYAVISDHSNTTCPKCYGGGAGIFYTISHELAEMMVNPLNDWKNYSYGYISNVGTTSTFYEIADVCQNLVSGPGATETCDQGSFISQNAPRIAARVFDRNSGVCIG